jgi:hypothetical protein
MISYVACCAMIQVSVDPFASSSPPGDCPVLCSPLSLPSPSPSPLSIPLNHPSQPSSSTAALLFNLRPQTFSSTLLLNPPQPCSSTSSLTFLLDPAPQISKMGEVKTSAPPLLDTLQKKGPDL